MNFQQLKETLISNNAQYNLEKIEEAYEYAELAHRGQLRNSGEKYIYHPLEVASILAELEMDDSTIIAGCCMMSLKIRTGRLKISVRILAMKLRDSSMG